MNRRNFIKGSSTLCGTIVLGSNILTACKKNNIAPVNFVLDLNDPANASLKKVGGYIVKDKTIVIRKDTTTYVSYSNICTHHGCTVDYDNGADAFYCECHGGQFDGNGKPAAGPPKTSLPGYKTTLNGNTLHVAS